MEQINILDQAIAELERTIERERAVLDAKQRGQLDNVLITQCRALKSELVTDRETLNKIFRKLDQPLKLLTQTKAAIHRNFKTLVDGIPEDQEGEKNVEVTVMFTRELRSLVAGDTLAEFGVTDLSYALVMQTMREIESASILGDSTAEVTAVRFPRQPAIAITPEYICNHKSLRGDSGSAP